MTTGPIDPKDRKILNGESGSDIRGRLPNYPESVNVDQQAAPDIASKYADGFHTSSGHN